MKYLTPEQEKAVLETIGVLRKLGEEFEPSLYEIKMLRDVKGGDVDIFHHAVKKLGKSLIDALILAGNIGAFDDVKLSSKRLP